MDKNITIVILIVVAGIFLIGVKNGKSMSEVAERTIKESITKGEYKNYIEILK